MVSVVNEPSLLSSTPASLLLPSPVHPSPRPRPSPYPHPYPPPPSQGRAHSQEAEFDEPAWMLMPDGLGNVRLAILSPEPKAGPEDDYGAYYDDDYDPGSNVEFILYTREHPEVGEKGIYNSSCASLGFSRFSPDRPSKILVHGFGDAARQSYMLPLLRDAFLSKGDYNIFLVDWSPLSMVPWYNSAATNTEVAAMMTAKLVDDLETTRGAKTSDFHLVGFSLGAHVVGIAGRILAERRPGDAGARIRRITGLDPAQVLFTSAEPSMRIDTSDAEFVEVVHTSGGYLGFMRPLGHVDVYPNGGAWPQPGCVLDFVAVCSHRRAYYIYSEAILAGGEGFEAQPCAEWGNLEMGDCQGTSYRLGTEDQTSARGIFFLDTNDEAPFAKTEDQYDENAVRR
ncbi:inactive pancreatic lipase-related protein 1-like [Hetaerina americana]|uniref:inactive pancreatic lipase-related protein 1-like n=1 Tax=Hetaerina americana TaxID=62018 RepID=UPI003A7F2B8B